VAALSLGSSACAGPERSPRRRCVRDRAVKDEEEAIAPWSIAWRRCSTGCSRRRPEPSWEILFVDDGSTDATLAGIQIAHDAERRVRAISLSRNFGKEAALSAGLDHARGRAVVPLDVDLQDPPEVIGEMLERWREGYEVVYGVRRNRATDSLPKRLTADLYYRAHNWLASDKIPEHAGDFRCSIARWSTRSGACRSATAS
jgi:glycosyltransferase involved in cell wall biosynthesis